MFSLRIFTINYYMVNPEPEYDQTYSDFRHYEVKQVPILRIFGSTPDGEKTCLHVHNVFPYLLIRNFRSNEQIDKFMYELAQNIDKTLNITLAQKDFNTQHVFKIELIQAKSMYGYHENISSFFKIYLYNPDLIKRLSDLLVNGVIMNEVFQPFYSHIPYNLQFLIDYNLFGMNFIHLDNVKYRRMHKELFFEQDEYFEPNWNDRIIHDENYLDEMRYPRQSLCEIECDCCVTDILNPNMQKDDVMLNPGLSALWNDERKRRKTLNLDGSITPPDSQERENILTAETETSLKTRLIELLEERFKSKYPFNKADKSNNFDITTISRMLSNSQLEEIDDECILNILDSLHNDTECNKTDHDDDDDDYEEDDYDSALVQATQLNDEDKKKIIEENNELTQKIQNYQKIDKKNNNETEIENENHEILNNSNLSSSSSSSDDDDKKSIINENYDEDDDEDDNDDEENNQSKNLVEFKSLINNHCRDSIDSNKSIHNSIEQNSSIIWSDFEIDSQDFIIKKPKLCTIKTKKKYKGDRKMLVKLEKLDTNEKAIKAAKTHYCQYFKTRSTLDECKHKNKNLSQNICLKCDFKIEQEDSLKHMAYLSPVSSNQKCLNLPIYTSPTIINNDIDDTSSETLTLKNDEIQNDNDDCDDTLVDEILDETLEESLNSNDSNSSLSICMSSDEGDSKEDLKREMRRIEFFKKIFQNNTELETSKIETVKYEDKINNNGFWFCPFDTITLDINECVKSSAGDSIICYSSDNNKKWKLNVDEFETIFKAKKNQFNNEITGSFWLTPAIPFPSFDRKITKPKKRKKLQKLISDTSQYDKCSIISSNGSVTSTLTKIESDISQFNASVTTSLAQTNSNTDPDIIPGTAIINEKKSIKIDLSQTLLKSKKKIVRFNEINEEKSVNNLITNDENSNDSSSNLSSVSQPIHEKTILDYSVCDETLQESMYLDSSKMSFYEYNSMLMPKCTKFIDSLTCTQDLTTTIIEPKVQATQNFKHNIEPTTLASKESNNLTIMSLEIHVNTRENLIPNPDIDSICFICYAFYTEANKNKFESNFILFDNQHRSLATTRFICGFSKKYFKSIDYVYNEEELIKKLIKIVQINDPDILVGFEIQKTSWCFLIKRALKLGINDICKLLSRLPKCNRNSSLRVPGSKNSKKSNDEAFLLPQDLQIGGRIVLNLWRVLRSEISLNIYTFENCCYHILHERTPKYNYSLLTNFFQHRTDLLRWKTIIYYAHRTESNLKIIEKLSLIAKTSEFARVYGIEFYHVLSRGSQYRVESMMIRIAKKLNYIPVSPSQQQKAKMRAPECIPLTLEPESKFYTDPVAILDFQSLYPSVIISFNICFTTCLGRIESIGKDGCFKFGCTSLFIPDDLIKSLDFDNDIYFAPSGVAFVKSHIRKGVLPIMLEDILKTRVMVKNSMKLYKNDQNLLDLLDARQLSLKLIANVTFGYTAANYSGRMPCTEIGDTIVRQARQILENSIKFIHSNFNKYNGRVVYGDTDSMFILFENFSKTKAFEVAHKIVNDISNMYKKPIKLKFEKIYYPCVLIAKKRYVGNSYETLSQLEPKLDAKGIEVIRRDGCQIASKILERCLKILFEFKDVDKVKNYLQRQCVKIIHGKINIKEFIIAKEYRGRETYQNVKSIAACQIANKNLIKDPLAEPLTGERVPYLIAYGPPGLPLYELVRAPEDFLINDDLKINYEYYIMKQILPPLDRVISLMSINVFDWVSCMSFKPKMFYKFAGTALPTSNTNLFSIGGGLTTLTKFLVTHDCMLCGKKCDINNQQQEQDMNIMKQGLCKSCSKLDPLTIIKLKLKFKKYEKQYSKLLKVCKACTSNIEYGNFNRKLECCSLDCPNLFLCNTTQQHLDKHDYIREIIDKYF